MSQLQVTGEAKIRDIQGPVVANDGVVTALDGAASQYVRGDGTLADFPTSSGGGSSVSYYLNSSVSQGTIGGVAYRELSKDPIIGAGTDIPISANGYVANYITDVNDPDVVLVPGGNFNCEFYFSVNNNTGNPTTYAELYKYDGTTFTLLGTSAGVPESINQGTTIAPYYFAIPVATAALSVTDRLAIRIYVNVDGRTVTLHTENGHLCQVVTTLSKGMVSLNNLTDQSQYLATGTSGTDFNIVSSGDTHTFNIPSASASNRGLITTGSQTIAGAKTFSNNVNINSQLFIFGGTGYGGGVSYRQGGILSTSDGSTTTEFPDANSIKYYVGQGSNTYKNFIFDVNNITLNATRTYNLPDLSGTLALLEADNMFTQVNMFDQSVNFKANGSLVGTSGYISQAYAKTGSGAGSTLSLKIQDGNSLKAINLDFVGSPATYTYTYPALSGTIALLEGSQTFSGAKTFSGLASFTNTSGINLQYGAYINKGNTPLAFSSGTTNIYSDATTNNIVIRDNSSIAKLEFNNSTQTYTFPAATGTLALTSNLSAYLPLTGGTLTGALSGTSATFSGTVEAPLFFANAGGSLFLQSASDAISIRQNSTSNNLTIKFNRSGVDLWKIQTVPNGANEDFKIFNSQNSTNSLTIASTGAATFSSSVFVGSSITSAATLHVNNLASGDPTSLSSVPTTNVFGMSTSPGAMLAAGIGTNGGSHVWLQGRNTGGAGVSYPISLQPLGGNVGIGRSSPSALLHLAVANASVDGTKGVKITNPAGTTVMLECGVSSDSFVGTTSASDFSIRTGNSPRMTITSGGVVNVLNDLGVGTATPSGKIHGVGINTSGSNNVLYLENAVATIMLQVRNDGNIRINSTVYNGTTAGSTRTLFVGDGGYFLGGISSIRASKDNIQNIENVNWIYQLNPVTFNYRKKDDEGNYTNETFDEPNYGLIAEDTQPIADFLINYNDKEDGTKEMVGIEYSRLITPMLKAIQEQQAQIEELKELIKNK